jgi:hypothetical protein
MTPLGLLLAISLSASPDFKQISIDLINYPPATIKAVAGEVPLSFQIPKPGDGPEQTMSIILGV